MNDRGVIGDFLSDAFGRMEAILGPLPTYRPTESERRASELLRASRNQWMIGPLLRMSEIMGSDLPTNVLDMAEGVEFVDLREGMQSWGILEKGDLTRDWSKNRSVIGPRLLEGLTSFFKRQGLMEELDDLVPVCQVAKDGEGVSALVFDVNTDVEYKKVFCKFEHPDDFLETFVPDDLYEILGNLAGQGYLGAGEGAVG